MPRESLSSNATSIGVFHSVRNAVRYFDRIYHEESLLKELSADERYKECLVKIKPLLDELCQIAKNLFYDHLKYESRHSTSPLPEEDIIPSSERSLEDCLCDAELARKLRTMVHTLSEPFKEVFLLRVYAELPFQEIGLMFDKSDVWARVTYLRAKEKVLKMLEASDAV